MTHGNEKFRKAKYGLTSFTEVFTNKMERYTRTVIDGGGYMIDGVC